MKTSNFRHKVFCMAYELMRATGKAFAVCLSRAWALYRLTKQMHKGIVSFAYEKSDGSLRKAKGTLKDIQNLIYIAPLFASGIKFTVRIRSCTSFAKTVIALTVDLMLP